ncbi:MAG: ferrous iron transport protein B [Oscillospiraceae bacterium]|nr:ferrous iron transport protein B [Oscillospiraceae bacterium]
MTIGFIGNPNCGKTTLFNAYTGAHLKVANWPGVTVEKKEGAMKYHNQIYKLVDLPGTYSLTSYTIEEIVSRNYILSDEVDVLINVVDASALERNLYLTLQLIELGKPVVMALNMMDIVEKRGMEIDLHRLPEILGIPAVPVSARKKTGLEILIHAAAHHNTRNNNFSINSEMYSHNLFHLNPVLTYSSGIENKIAKIISALRVKYPDMENCRWHAIKLLEKDDEITRKCIDALSDLTDVIDRSYETDIINQKYEFIETIIEEVLVNKEKSKDLTDRADALLTHKIWGLPLFLLIMALVFFLTFTVGDFLKIYFEIFIKWATNIISSALTALQVSDIIYSLVVNGILAGVGGLLSFLPNIFILFLALAFLEDSGYMSRVAYVMDGIMGKFGVSGKGFIPMLLGFGCSVPAVMATRALESRKDRLRVMFLIPFMSCSAKLPIYVLFSGMFFPKYAMLAAYSMYILGLVIAIIAAFVINKTDRKKEANMLLIEMPEYKSPSAHTIIIYVWDKIKDYLSRAGTVILVASIVIWFILNFGFSGYTQDISKSFGAVLGKYLVPVLNPIGLGWWQVGVALIAGISAKEVIAASFAVLFGISNILSHEGMSTLAPVLSNMGFGALNAYVLMTFALLYPPCIAALATIKRESGSWRQLGLIVVLQICVAWGVSFIVYRIGGLFI